MVVKIEIKGQSRYIYTETMGEIMNKDSVCHNKYIVKLFFQLFLFEIILEQDALFHSTFPVLPPSRLFLFPRLFNPV
jgi:hypothetical protein